MVQTLYAVEFPLIGYDIVLNRKFDIVLSKYLLEDFSAAQALHSEQCTPEYWNCTLYSVPVSVYA